MAPTGLKTRIKEMARTLGFADAGVVAPAPTDHAAFYRWWVREGLHGEMAYLAREDAVERRGDLSRTLPQVRSVVVVADHYPAGDAPGSPEDPSRGIIARYARGRDYHNVLAAKLRALARGVEEELRRSSAAEAGPRAPASGPAECREEDPRHRVYVDTGPVLERDLARRAGLGWFGRNTMLIHPRRGSYFFLGVLLTTLELEPDPPFEADHCGSCTACLDACPTGALLGRDENGAPVMDARKCISYLTIENRGAIPEELRSLMGNRVFGCDICQEVCPWNRRFAAERTEPDYAARGPGERPTGVEVLPGEDVSVETHPGTEEAPLVDLLETALDEAAWDSFSRGSAIRRAGRVGFARNVCVGLGNGASPAAVPSLVSALSDPEPLVRGHAAWALGQIGSSPAVSALEERSEVEADSFVVDEIRRALPPPGRPSVES